MKKLFTFYSLFKFEVFTFLLVICINISALKIPEIIKKIKYIVDHSIQMESAQKKIRHSGDHITINKYSLISYMFYRYVNAP